MFPSFALPQARVRLQYKLASLVLFLVLGQHCTTGIEIDATGFLLLSPPSMRGNLSSNNVLLKAERLHSGQVGVPHSSVVIGDDVFAATSRGVIVNVAPCRPVVIANLRPRGCRTLQECGHLISIRRSTDNFLIVLDAYRGVFEVHPVTGVIRKLFDSRALVNGRPCVYLNDVVIMKDGTMVVSDSSPRFDYDHEFWIRFEGRADGRLIGFSPVYGQSKEIMSGLAYPTGLEISSNGQALLVSEASRARILRLDLSKDKFFHKSYVNINLPGMPEHIRRTVRGTYWVALSYPRFRGETSPLDQYSNKASTRNFMALLGACRSLNRNQYLPPTHFQRKICHDRDPHYSEQFHVEYKMKKKKRSTINEVRQMFKKRGLAVELDETGKIMRSVHDPSGVNVSEVLEVTEYIGVLYVGTRSQQATIRVVGDPSELNVDSLVQVLRGRCKVSDDKIQATKESIEKQLQGTSTQKPQNSTATIQLYTPHPPHTHNSDAQSPKTEKLRLVVNLQSLTRGLSKLHRALLNATVSNKKVPHTTHVLQQDTTYQQTEKLLPPPTEQIIPIHQPPLITGNLQAGSTPASPSTRAPTNDPPLQQNNNAPQRIEGRLSVQFSHNSASPPTVSSRPSVVYGTHDGHFSSHAVLSQQPQDTRAGHTPGPQQGVPGQKQEIVTGYPSGQQQGTHSQKPQETSVGYPSAPQQDVPIQKPQETSIGYPSPPQKDVPIQKPQETSTGYPSAPQQAVPIQKPQETSIGYPSLPQQDVPIQKPQETSIGYPSPPQQEVLIQKPQEMSIGYPSAPQQNVPIQKPQETSIGYPTPQQQDVPIQKPQETSIGYPSAPQQGIPGQKSQEMFARYPSGLQQGAFDQKPQETYTGYPSGPQQGILNQKPQETSMRYPSVPQQGQVSFTETSHDPVHIPIKQPYANVVPIISTQTPVIHKVEIYRHGDFILGAAREPVTPPNPPEMTTEGGFMGFLGNSASQNDASNMGFYTFQQDFGGISDPGLYGQIEPGINMNPRSSQRRHQFLPGMEPVVNFEQLSIPNDQTTNTEQAQPVNQTQARASNSPAQSTGNSEQPRGPKRPAMNVQDISMKDAVEIQNMQMFHPTDRPELSIQYQNQAAPKTEITFQENAQPFSNEMEQFLRTSLSQRPNEEYASVQGGHFQAQAPQALTERQQNLQSIPQALTERQQNLQSIPQALTERQQNLQSINTFGHGRSSSPAAAAGGADRAISQTSHAASNTPIELVDPSTPLHQSFSVGNF